MMIMAMLLSVFVVVIRVLGSGVREIWGAMLENKDRNAVDDEPDHRNDDGLIECDRYGSEQSIHALIGHERCKTCQQNGAGESAERIDFAGAKAITRIMRMLACIDVGSCVDPERYRVGCHVQPVRQQRHRAEQHAGNDLDDHHGRSNCNHDERFRLSGAPLVLAENVGVAPARKSIVVHVRTLTRFGYPEPPWIRNFRICADAATALTP